MNSSTGVYCVSPLNAFDCCCSQSSSNVFVDGLTLALRSLPF
jgi:hypothetical protein